VTTPHDPGPGLVAELRDALQIEPEWRFESSRGVAWWPHEFVQRLWADEPRSDGGVPGCRIHVETDVLEVPEPSPHLDGLLAELNTVFGTDLAGFNAAVTEAGIPPVAFLPKGENSRVEGDVLDINRQYLLFDFGDFNGFLVSGDWSITLGNYIEASAGFGFYQSTVPAIYGEWVNEDGSEIEQDLKLRIMPATAVVRA